MKILAAKLLKAFFTPKGSSREMDRLTTLPSSKVERAYLFKGSLPGCAVCERCFLFVFGRQCYGVSFVHRLLYVSRYAAGIRSVALLSRRTLIGTN